MEKLLSAACCLCLSATWISSAPVQKGEKTPRSIEIIFIGRCHEYQEVIKPEFFPDGKKKDCNKLWRHFKSAFAFKNPCEVPTDSYEEYSQAADHGINAENKLMLWSGGLSQLAADISADTRRYTTVGDILAVYVVKHLKNWCGRKGGSGVEFDGCPVWSSCTDHSVASYWNHMSKTVALKARGTVNVLLNASSGTAFLLESVFGRMELPNLDASRTPRLIVHLVRNLDEVPKETCASGSLLELRKLVEDKGMVFECRENEKYIRFMQCVDRPEQRDCILLN